MVERERKRGGEGNVIHVKHTQLVWFRPPLASCSPAARAIAQHLAMPNSSATTTRLNKTITACFLQVQQVLLRYFLHTRVTSGTVKTNY